MLGGFHSIHAGRRAGAPVPLGGFASGCAYSPRGPSRPAWALPKPKRYARLRAGPSSLGYFRPAFCALRVPHPPAALRLRAGSAPARRARGPRAPRRLRPRLLRSALVRPRVAAGSAGALCPPGGLLPIRSAAGSLAVALASLRVAVPLPSVAAPLGAARCRSLRSLRLRGLASGLRPYRRPLRPGAASPLSRALVRSAAPGSGCRAGVRRLALPLFRAAVGSVRAARASRALPRTVARPGALRSPLRPPAPPPPLGAPGGPVPPTCAALLAALFPARPAARAPPPRRDPCVVDKPEIVNRGLHGMCDRRNLPLTFPGNRGIFEVRCPCRSHLRAAREGIHGRQKPLGINARRLKLLPHAAHST